MTTIQDLPGIVAGLKKEDKELFDRFFSVHESIGHLTLPEEMKPWADKTFGDHKYLEEQKIVKIFNKQTFEDGLYNDVRSRRPMVVDNNENLLKDIKEAEGDNFCHPLTGSPENRFGRVRGKHCVTAANVAKYDSLSGMVIFKKHNPLEVDRKDVKDYLEVIRKWFAKAHEYNPKAIFPFIMWNCLWRSGGSMIHGHMQMILGEEVHYGEPELLKHLKLEYAEKYNAEFFKDIYQVHESIGLGIRKGDVRIFTNIVPRKEKEITIFADKFTPEFEDVLYKCVRCLMDDFGVQTFNVGIILPPLEKVEGWEGFPIYARILDRGDLRNKTTDFGGMEVYARSYLITTTNTYQIIEKLKEKFENPIKRLFKRNPKKDSKKSAKKD
ncbi:hypothetical protein JW826_02755 [Candidatus Woesearchaeota archaeon]|nr:hypothetical protein [Candidatus Woesearchaeota archaeon]